jgi:hypothetical protein
MKPAHSSLTIQDAQRRGSPLTLALLWLVACTFQASAQNVLAPSQPDLQYQPQVAQQTTQLSATTNAVSPVPAFLQWGSVTAHPRISYSFVSSTGVQYQPGSATNTTIQTLSPGITLELGTHWSLDYQASWNVYSSRQFNDTLDHALSLLGATTYENWTFNFSQGFSRSTQPLIQTGRQTQQDQYSTSITALDRLDQHLMLETDASQSLLYTTDFNDTKEWSLLEWLHYQFSPQLDTALGIGPGYVEVNNGADMNYYKFLGKIDWRPSTKLNLHLDGGLDHRRLRTANASYIDNPIANASIGYKIFDHTMLTFGASRTVSASYFANQIQKSLGWNAGVNQRLLGIFNLSLSAGDQKSTYELTDPTTSTTSTRDDNDHWYDARVSTVVLKRGTISIFYRRSKNASSTPGYSFSSNQVGLEFRYQY